MVLVTFVLSCDLFWGYSMVLHPIWFTSIEALISCIKVTLCIMLKQNSLDVLNEKCKDMSLHIHDHTLESLQTVTNGSTVYICDHRC